MITRENYEEFFLSYVDDELSVTARAAVEQFVADNPDLGPELEALTQCRVTPDHEPGFGNKDILFQYESSLLSYVDGELEEPDRASLDEWVRRHPGAARGLRQLQMTVSHPDMSVVFPGKESLYSDRRRRAVILPWLRAGVAAAVLGGAALLFLSRQQSAGSGGRRTDVVAKAAPKKIPGAVTSVAPDTLYSTKERKRKGGSNEPGDRQTSAVAIAKKRDTPRPVTGERTPGVVQAAKNEVVIVDPPPLKQEAITVEPAKLSTAAAVVNIPKEQSVNIPKEGSFATQALMQQEQEESIDNSVAEASATPAKNKLRGLFRKVGRAFGTTAERDGDGQRQVLIGAFQVALK